MFLYILKSLSVIQPQNNKHENRFILSTSKAVLKLIYFHWSDSPPPRNFVISYLFFALQLLLKIFLNCKILIHNFYTKLLESSRMLWKSRKSFYVYSWGQQGEFSKLRNTNSRKARTDALK